MGPKIFILADFEGATGVVDPNQVIPGRPGYENARQHWMADVNAAIEGAVEAGASEILVSEGHYLNLNIIPEALHPEASHISGLLKENMQMGGLDSSFGGVFMFIHSMAGTPRGVLSHTWSPSGIQYVRLNGRKVGEMGLCAAMAGTYGVPVILIVGDEAVAEEARQLLGTVASAVTKIGYDHYTARCFTPAETQRRIREAAEEAVRQIDTYQPYQIAPPVTIEIGFTSPSAATLCSFIPQVNRSAALAVSFTSNDYREVFHLGMVCAFLADVPFVRERLLW